MKDNVLLETRSLSKSFGKRKVIDGLDLKIERGDIYGFLGPNGSGKTTTIRMLLGLIRPEAGEVIINGYRLDKDFKNAIARIGAIVENPAFYPYLSGYDNLKLMANITPGIPGNRIREVLEIVGLEKRSQDKVGTYSLGMRQRLGIANALLPNPHLIILDEPTNGLDPQGIKEVRETISQLAAEQDITFFISSHLLGEVEQVCNKVGILKKGKLLAQGYVKELMSQNNEALEVHTAEGKRVLEVMGKVNYVKSAELLDYGAAVQIERGFSSSLNRLLMENGIAVSYLIPSNNSLEKFFFEVTEGSGIK